MTGTVPAKARPVSAPPAIRRSRDTRGRPRRTSRKSTWRAGRTFPNIESARAWVQGFVTWYNGEHLHTGIRYVTPDDRHAGRDKPILARRHVVYTQAQARTPQRWSRSTRNWSPIGTVYLDPVKQEIRTLPLATPVS